MASLFQSIKYSKEEINEDYLRHLILNTYRFYRKKFHKEYGELVLCHDSTNYWRKDDFPHYKANRKKSMEKSDLDWKEVFSIMDKIRSEIEEVFPYKNLRIMRMEADDIIAALCQHFHETEKIIIVSNDKDFQQLQRYPNVEQYSPQKKQKLICEDPEEFLINHIIRGDSSDGIPNILSDSDTFVVEGKRQKPCGGKKYAEIITNINEWRNSENWSRNQKLIDLNCLPDLYRQKAIDLYNNTSTGDRSGLLNYFVSKKLKNLMSTIEEF